MPNDTTSSEDSIQTLIDSATVTHKLVVSGLSESEETPFLRAVCEYVAGSIYRVKPFEYLIQIDEDDGDLAQTLPGELDGRFDSADVVLSDLASARSEEAEPDTPSQEFEIALKSGAVTYAQYGNVELANAVVTAEFAGLLAQKAANRIANLTFEAQESMIAPRLDAIEGRFDRLEAALEEAASSDFTKQLEQISKSLAEHADRLDGNLTQDRLDTLIALVTPTASQSDEKDISNERLATAIETLLQTMRETSQPTPALMDPYFAQLDKQSQGLIAALDRNADSIDGGASIRAQIHTFQTMAQSATQDGALSSSEKMEMLEEISMGLSALMSRIMSMVQRSSIPENPIEAVGSDFPSEDVDLASDAAKELHDRSEIDAQAEPEKDAVEGREPSMEVLEDEVPEAEMSKHDAIAEDLARGEPAAINEVGPADRSLNTGLELTEDAMEFGEPVQPEECDEVPSALSDDLPEQKSPETPDEEEVENTAAFDAPFAESGAQEVKLEFETPKTTANQPEPAISKHMPTEDELDQRVEELLRGPSKQGDASQLHRKTG